eukprot:993935-Amphidinium_carterae.1
MSATPDILHRLANDVDLGYSRCGLTPTKLEYRLVLSVRSGPYKSGSNQALLRECVGQLRITSAWNDPLWSFFVGDVACEKNMHLDVDEGTIAHSKRVFDRCMEDLERVEATGLKLSRWFAWERRLDSWLEKEGHASTSFLISWLGIRRGWFKRWSQLPAMHCGASAEVMGEDEGNEEERADSDEGHENEGDAGEGVSTEDASGALDKSKAEVKVRKRVNENLLASARILAERVPLRMVKAMLRLSEPVARLVDELIGAIKEPETWAAHRVSWSCHGMQGLLLQVTQRFESVEFAAFVGCLSREPNRHTEREDTEVASMIFELYKALMVELAATSASFMWEPPA